MKKLKNSDFTVSLELNTGRAYNYSYLIDGNRWENDWCADRYEQNPYGGENSVVEVWPIIRSHGWIYLLISFLRSNEAPCGKPQGISIKKIVSLVIAMTARKCHCEEPWAKSKGTKQSKMRDCLRSLHWTKWTCSQWQYTIVETL